MKISKDKRNKLIGVGIGTAVVIGVIYWFLIAPQDDSLADAKPVRTIAVRFPVAYLHIIESEGATIGVSRGQFLTMLVKRQEKAVAAGDPAMSAPPLVHDHGHGHSHGPGF